LNLEIETIRQLCELGAIKWTAHVLARLQERNIQPSDIKNCIMTGQIIEQYSSDYPYPSCLVLGSRTDSSALHTVVGVGQNYLWLITAYCPDPQKWNDDFSKRKELHL